jgi:Family of unknown function (DUF5996)
MTPEAMRSRTSLEEVLPALPFDSWKDTLATLHMWAQIVGKVRLKLSYTRECQEKHLPLGSVPRYFSRHSAQLIGRAPTVCEWSSSGVLFVSSREAARHFFSPVVPFHGCDSAIRFLKRTSLTVIHWMSGNAWSYLRLVVYGFLGLSEGA